MYLVNYIYYCLYKLHNVPGTLCPSQCTRYTMSFTMYQVHSVLYPLQDAQAGVITKEPLTAAAAVISGSLVQ